MTLDCYTNQVRYTLRAYKEGGELDPASYPCTLHTLVYDDTNRCMKSSEDACCNCAYLFRGSNCTIFSSDGVR